MARPRLLEPCPSSPSPTCPPEARQRSPSTSPTLPPVIRMTPSLRPTCLVRCNPGGLWCGRLGQVGQTDWFAFPVRAGHTFTIVTQALNESGLPTETKALPAIGVWDAFKTTSATTLNWAPALNGYATGETWLQVTTSADDIVRLGIADMRGDGRPDYAYNGWVLYADTIQPPVCLPVGRSHRDSRNGLSTFRHRPHRRPESRRHQHLAERNHRHRPRSRARRHRLSRRGGRRPAHVLCDDDHSPAASATTPPPATRSLSTPRPPTPFRSAFPSRSP